MGSLARQGRIGSPAGRGRIGTRGEAGRQQKLKVDNEEEKIFSYVNNKEKAAAAGHAETGAGLGSQIPFGPVSGCWTPVAAVQQDQHS